jgi:hypothetical protein
MTRVWPDGRTDDEAIEVHGKADHWRAEGGRSRRQDGRSGAAPRHIRSDDLQLEGQGDRQAIVADEARYDGISVLRTNARITPLQAVIRYRDLLQVEALFRVAKASFDTRPIFHQSDAAIRGHVFVSFLALTLAKELTRLCQEKGLQPEWQPLLNDLDRLQEASIEKDGKVITTRTHVSGQVGNVFKATGIALPANISELPPRT